MPGPVIGPGNPLVLRDNSGDTLIARVAGAAASSTDGGNTWANLGGGGSLSADTFIQVLNSAPALVNAIELLATLPTGTPGAEVAKLLIRMLNAGTWTDVTAQVSPAIAAVVSGTAATENQYRLMQLRCRAMRFTFTPSSGTGSVKVIGNAASRG